ncbi:hypothetical protein QUA43_25945 [Microcoleus sp. N9_B4]
MGALNSFYNVKRALTNDRQFSRDRSFSPDRPWDNMLYVLN